jgi:TDG/mug DNA glycosylase family protein
MARLRQVRTPRRLADHIHSRPRVLFVGINPGIRSALVGHHFAGYSNRFWKLLYESGLIPNPISCEQDGRLPEWNFGITNLVARASGGIHELRPEEYRAGCARLKTKITRFRPEVVALVGVTLYRALFQKPGAKICLGLQTQTLARAPVFVLPNPSGRNANYSYGEMLNAFRALKDYLHACHSARSEESQSLRRPHGRG